MIDLIQGGGKVPLQPNYVLSMTADELLLKNYEGQVFRYRNPNSQDRQGGVTAAPPVSGVVESLLAATTPPVKAEGEVNADRVIVRS